MDSQELKMECLKLANSYANYSHRNTLDIAQDFYDFIIGAKRGNSFTEQWHQEMSKTLKNAVTSTKGANTISDSEKA